MALNPVLLEDSCILHTASYRAGADCRKFDEYADLRFNDEKARLDNLAIQLQQEPGAQAYYVIFGSCDTEGRGQSRSRGGLPGQRAWH